VTLYWSKEFKSIARQFSRITPHGKKTPDFNTYSERNSKSHVSTNEINFASSFPQTIKYINNQKLKLICKMWRL